MWRDMICSWCRIFWHSGLTLSYLRELLRDRHPNSIKIVTLLNKLPAALRIFSRITAALKCRMNL